MTEFELGFLLGGITGCGFGIGITLIWVWASMRAIERSNE